MTISEFIAELVQIRARYGDLEIHVGGSTALEPMLEVLPVVDSRSAATTGEKMVQVS